MNRVFSGRRVFLGWQHPALHSAVQYLWTRYAQPSRADMGQAVGGQAAGGQRRSNAAAGCLWQLSDVIVIVPGGRAGRRLNQLLADRAAREGVVYFPPEVTTAGQLPERLYAAKRPFASQLVQQLAWAKALQTSKETVLRTFLTDLPAEDDASRWFELAALLWRQHRELAADGLNFERVAVEGANVPGFDETQRWQGLADVQTRYLRLLDGLQLWDRQTARLVALEQRECATDKDLILVGTVDMNRALRQMLQQVERHVTSLVFADDSWAEKFDDLGCVRPSQWLSATIPLFDEQLHQVDGPAEQAACVINLLADLPEKFAANQISVGVPNERLVPSIMRRLQQVAVPARYGPGESIEASRPVRLMRVVADYVLDRRVTTLMDLLRHPDVVRRFRRDDMFFEDDVDQLDQVYRDHLPVSITDLIRPELRKPEPRSPQQGQPQQGQPRWIQSVTRLVEAVERWLAPLTTAGELAAKSEALPAVIAESASAEKNGGDTPNADGTKSAGAAAPADNAPADSAPADSAPADSDPADSDPADSDPADKESESSRSSALRRPPAAWVTGILEVLRTIYDGTILNPEDVVQRRTLKGCQELRRGIAELQEIPKRVAPAVGASEAILMSVEAIASQQIAPLADPDAVELLGWLELPLDDAPVCIVTQLNEGSVPTSSTNDLFLPDALRAHLGLDDNQRRYARDAYALTALAKSRERLHLILGRRDHQGNPLLPSRLLFSADPSTITSRSIRFFGEPTDTDIELSADIEALLKPTPTAEPISRVDVGDDAARTSDALRSTRFAVPPPQSVSVPSAGTNGATTNGALTTGALTTGAGAHSPLDLPLTLNVTDFKRYLDCPYRFYLTRIAKLREVLPEPDELDGAAFGNRLHDVLEQFGKSDTRDSQDAGRIEDFLLTALHASFRYHYGSRPRAVLQLQRAQMELRLKSFAAQQVDWRRQGWRILMAESEGKAVDWTLAGREQSDQPIGLRGRIDRVDCNELDGRFAVLDYKSSDTGKKPRAVHHRGRSPVAADDWTDLQLPLYRHFATALNLGDPDQLVLGYITLPRAANGCGFLTAGWQRQELQLADEAAWDVVTRIRQGQFWPPAENPAFSSPALDRICQESVFDRQIDRQDIDSESGSAIKAVVEVQG